MYMYGSHMPVCGAVVNHAITSIGKHMTMKCIKYDSHVFNPNHAGYFYVVHFSLFLSNQLAAF